MAMGIKQNEAVSIHYKHGTLLQSIEEALEKLGKNKETVSIEDLGPVDEFHVGGRVATERFMARLNFGEKQKVLDIGCGLGGAARYVASTYNVMVSGIDLTEEYISTGSRLNQWLGLEEQVELQYGSALNLPYMDHSLNAAYMLHVGMNIEDKEGLFQEIYRVLTPGAIFGIYDIMRTSDEDPMYPVPWAADIRTSHLDTSKQYLEALSNAGFNFLSENNRRTFASDFFQNLKAKVEEPGGPPPLGLHTLMKESTAIKIANMINGIAAGLVAPVEMIVQKN